MSGMERFAQRGDRDRGIIQQRIEEIRRSKKKRKREKRYRK